MNAIFDAEKAQEEEKIAKQKLMERRIGDVQRAAIMAQRMHPETLAGLFVGQLLGDAVGRWLNRDKGITPAGDSSSTGAIDDGSGTSTPGTVYAESTVLDSNFGDVPYTPSMRQADYMLTGKLNYDTASPELKNEIVQKGIENTLNGRAPFDNNTAALDFQTDLGLLGEKPFEEDYSLLNKAMSRYRGWR